MKTRRYKTTKKRVKGEVDVEIIVYMIKWIMKKEKVFVNVILIMKKLLKKIL